MAFTYLTSNKNNVIRVIRLPIEVVCIQAKRIYSSIRSKKIITLRWDIPIATQNITFPLQELLSCRVKEVQVKESRIIPFRATGRVYVEVCYLVKVEVIYRDSVGNVGITVLREEVRRRSRPLHGNSAMSGTADISLELLHCYVEKGR